MNQCTPGPSNNHSVGCRKVVMNRLLTNNAKIQRPSYLPSDQKGDWIWGIYKYSTTSERFSNFMLILKKFWTLIWKRDVRNTKFIVDNTDVHIAQNTKLATIHLDCEILWLPQYSPNLAPVEWVFGVSKKIIRNLKPLRTINFFVEFRQKRHNWKHGIIK